MLTSTHVSISCYFGGQTSFVHPAPNLTRSIFFTNNEQVLDDAQKKGWETIFIEKEGYESTLDIRISSIQSKYIKFLQFLNDYCEFKEYSQITYFDHKIYVKPEHILWVLTRNVQNKAVLLRYSPKEKFIDEEILIAMGQPRYAYAMEKTKQWLKNLHLKTGTQFTSRIANTGFIHYYNYNKVLELLNQVYSVCFELGQPECQIFWAALSPNYANDIQYINVNDLKMYWKEAAMSIDNSTNKPLKKSNHFSVASKINFLKAMANPKWEPFEDAYKENLKGLNDIVKSVGEKLEGNIFYANNQVDISTLSPRFLNKRRTLALAAQEFNNVVEIGFNAGHSALLLLTANPCLHLTCIDICSHAYTIPCYEYLHSLFGDRIQLIEGNSLVAMPILASQHKAYDFYIIDGGHGLDTAASDLHNIIYFSKPGSVILFDDTGFPPIRLLLETYIISAQLLLIADLGSLLKAEDQMFFINNRKSS